MEGEPDLRRGEPLRAVAAHAGNVESCGAAVNSGRRETPEFLGCGVNSTGRMNECSREKDGPRLRPGL